MCWACVGAGCLLAAAYLVVGLLDHTDWVPSGLYYTPAALAAFVLWVRTATRAEDRRAWGLIALGLTLWVGGDAWVEYGPSTSRLLTVDDGLFTAGYLCLMFGVTLAALQRRMAGGLVRRLAGYISGAAAAALVVATMLHGVTIGTGTFGAFAQTAWFIMLALVSIAVVTIRLGRAGWYPGGQLGTLCAAVALNATTDLFYLSPLSARSVVAVSVMDAVWLVSFMLFAIAALLPDARQRVAETLTWRDAAIPNSWLLLALGIVVADGVVADIPLTATLLATLALVLGGVRAAIVFGEHVGLVEQMRREARHDHLTGLPNRRALMEELPAAMATGEGLRLVLCDLNGFKAYNDTRGHQEGDVLLALLADRLARLVEGRGRAYRLGGDEFCVVWPLTSSLQVRDVEHALTQRSARTPISSACGDVEIPVEAPDVDTALRMADARMYAHKTAQRTAAAAS